MVACRIVLRIGAAAGLTAFTLLAAPAARAESSSATADAADQTLAATAEEARKTLADASKPTSIVVSGGVSLGSYQAGLLHYYSLYQASLRDESARLSPELSQQPQTITGASAGAVNAFLAVVAGCREPVRRPEESLFYKVWIPIGIQGLLEPGAVTPISLLSTKSIDDAVAVVTRAWADRGGWRKDGCLANVGLSATRVTPRSVPLSSPAVDTAGKTIAIPVQTEHVLLSVSGKGGAPPRIWSWVPDPEQSDPDLYESFAISSGEHDEFPEGLADVLRASSAFPVAWPFVYVRVPREGTRRPFLDGGVFDNNPLRLARNIIRWSRASTQMPGTAHEPAPIRYSAGGNPRFLYIEPDATAWDTSSATPEPRAGSFLETYTALLLNFADTARKADLLTTIQEDRDIRNRIDVPVRRAPVYGSYLLNFFAFFDEDFRRYDFYAGMADAYEMLESPPGQATKLRALGVGVHVDVESKAFDCMLKVRRSHAGSARELPECQGVFDGDPDGALHSANFIALIDAAAAVRTFIDACSRMGNCASSGEFSVMLSALTRCGFRFSDPRLRGTDPADMIRDNLHPLLGALARQQPGMMGPAIASVTMKAAADAIRLRPPRWTASIGLRTDSGADATYSHRIAGIYRWDASLRIYRVRVETIASLNGQTLYYALHPSISPLSFHVPTGPWWLEFGGSAGFGADLQFVRTSLVATRPSADFEIHTTLAQRVSLKVNTSWFLDSCPSDCSLLSERYRADVSRLAPGSWKWGLALSWHWID